MTSNTSHVPYAQRLARESVKFGVRVGGTLLKHAGLGLLALPVAMLTGGSRDADEAVAGDNGSHPANWKTGYLHDENGTPGIVPQDELEDYHNGFI